MYNIFGGEQESQVSSGIYAWRYFYYNSTYFLNYKLQQYTYFVACGEPASQSELFLLGSLLRRMDQFVSIIVPWQYHKENY